MNKSVRFSEEPDLVRQLSDRSIERRQNSQTPNEKRLAVDSFYREEQQKINEQQKNIKKYKNIPISRRVSDAVSKGTKESSQIRNENIAQEHRYDHWWLGGKKLRRKSRRRPKKSIGRKSRKNRK